MLGEIIQGFVISIVIFLTSFLPANPEKVVVDTSAITSQSAEMIFEIENRTGRVIDQPTLVRVSQKTEEGWNDFFENPVMYDEEDYVLPGSTEKSRVKNVEYWYGKPTLDPGEYKVKIKYRLHESKDVVKYVTVEVPFVVE